MSVYKWLSKAGKLPDDSQTGLLGEPINKKFRQSRRFKYFGERQLSSTIPTIRLLQGDVTAALKIIPDESVHCCVTSPPYYGLRNYGHVGQIGLEPSPNEYVATLVAVFREVRRVLRSDGTFWLNIGNSYHSGSLSPGRNDTDRMYASQYKDLATKPKDLIGIPWMLAFALRTDGWYLRSEIIWNKINSMPESVTDRPTSSHETIFLFTKNEKYYYDNESVKEQADTKERIVTTVGGYRSLRNVWTMASEPLGDEHFAAFPSELPYRAVLAGTSGHGCCSKCAAPWTRQVGPQYQVEGRGAGQGFVREHRISLAKGDPTPWVPKDRDTIGWQPTCTCNAGLAPSTVLDPFSGSGTTALVAAQLQCNAIGIELNPKYIEISRKRCEADVALLGKAHVLVEVVINA